MAVSPASSALQVADAPLQVTQTYSLCIEALRALWVFHPRFGYAHSG
ncbi:MAG: hypothetical protein I8H71_00900 [Xanthomonadaceae bacterium]|nr:hypothetical protein [Xanthomonadaceae bacterium]